MSTWGADEVTDDAFLGGRLTLRQPRRGYRAGLDPVILSATVPARPGQSALDLGCGGGAAMLCLGARVSGLRLAGLEVQADYAALARSNAESNGIEAEVHRGDVSDMPRALTASRFDHVIANPPYYDRGSRAGDDGRAMALWEDLPLGVWIAAGSRRLAPKGMLSVIQRADRLPELLSAMDETLGSLRIRLFQPRPGQPINRVVVQAIKGGRTPAAVDAPIPLHGTEGEAGEFTPTLTNVLRYGATLD